MILGLIFFWVWLWVFATVIVAGIIVIAVAFGYFADYLIKKWKEKKR